MTSSGFDAGLWDGYAPFFDAEEGTVFPVDSRELRFYELMRKRIRGRALEIGAGCGRLAASLFAGDLTAALEPSAGMLARWKPGDRALAARVRALGQDMPFRDGSFGLVAFPYNGLHCLLDPEDRVALLRESGRVLEPGGRLILETCTLFHTRPEVSDAERYDYHDGGTRLRLVESVRMDRERGSVLFDMTYHSGRSRSDLLLELALIPQDLLLSEIDRAGLAVTDTWGGYDLSPFLPDESPRMLTIASRKDAGCPSSSPR